MIKFEYERENQIVFDVNVGSTDFVGEPEVSFCIDLGTMILATKAARGDNISYSAIVPENIPNQLGKTYSCYVEVVIGTRRFVPFNDEVMFTQGNSPEVRLNSNKPVKPKSEPAPVEESVKPKKPQRRVQPAIVAEEKPTKDTAPIGDLVKLAASEDTAEQERKVKEQQLVDIFKSDTEIPESVMSKSQGDVHMPKFEMKGLTSLKSSHVKEDKSNHVVDMPLVKVVRAEVVDL